MNNIDISVCPTDLPEDSDPSFFLSELESFVNSHYSNANIRCIQIGHRQGHKWAAINGDDESGDRFMELFWEWYNSRDFEN